MPIPTVRKHLWSRSAFERMVEVGGFEEDDRIELLDGEIWEMSPPGSRHTTCVLLIEQALRSAPGTGFHVRGEQPFALDDSSQPQPDIAVVRGAIRDYSDRHPGEALLLVEVSDTTLSHDRGRKLAVYARSGLSEYWILDLNTLGFEVYRDPSGTEYKSKAVLSVRDTVAPLFAPDAAIAVADLLP